MSLGECTVCQKEQAKYRCPKCPVKYCSLVCFKSPLHSHDIVEETAAPQRPEKSGEPVEDEEPSINQKIANDPVIQSLLKYKSLQVHIAVIIKLLTDSSITNEPLAENRREIANMRLCDLRMGGAEENELVEEFVSRVIELTG
ncbi:uncharacterized protein CXQ87_003131 [Candidozyma duobushaemuli]|uniref:HIT-type domain-containing protein n=1 Tax=Candidozyma duobushaemuli TaxID=1231522 RepID=A0A2V1ADE3_9ASCO|nr:uncharacterized protein CXQ87_003131 [[Candida] duobushaemulonis]PVH15293.1 hypothetical protein CXQ87_003131 [[Candida] duobushaemulonis]